MAFTALEARTALAMGWIARVQLIPLAMASSFTLLGVWLLVTLLFGRVYCSTVCPMGTLQDLIARLPRMGRGWQQSRPYHFKSPTPGLRYGSLALIAACFVGGFSLLLALFDPWSAFGRIAGNFLTPLVELIGGRTVLAASATALSVAAVTFAGIAWASWRWGRKFCNTLCPAGNSLSIVSRCALFHFDIDTDVCVNCRRCEHVCKAQCIDLSDHVIDSSRCVVCFDCLAECPEDAISYTTRRKRLALPMMQKVKTATPTAMSESQPQTQAMKIDRRRFMATGLLVAAAPAMGALADRADRIAAHGTGMHPLRPLHYVAPPGKKNLADFLESCTGCGLCIAQCKGHTLRASSNEFGWLHALHPVADYDRGYCLYDCTVCTDLCPAGALTPLTADEKHLFVIGKARVEADNCIGCGACRRACPRHAITMVPRTPLRDKPDHTRSPLIAAVDTDLCIGCGACQYACPVFDSHPFKAIIVDGEC